MRLILVRAMRRALCLFFPISIYTGQYVGSGRFFVRLVYVSAGLTSWKLGNRKTHYSMKMQTPWILAIGFVSLLCLTTPHKAAGQTTAINENNSSVKQDLEKRFREYSEALTKRDLNALEQIWTDDYVFINPRGELVTKSQRLSNLKTGATEFQAIRPKSERTEVHGNVALDVGTVTLEGTKYGGKESSGDYRYMTVWVNNDGRWQMIANQITRIAH